MRRLCMGEGVVAAKAAVGCSPPAWLVVVTVVQPADRLGSAISTATDMLPLVMMTRWFETLLWSNKFPPYGLLIANRRRNKGETTKESLQVSCSCSTYYVVSVSTYFVYCSSTVQYVWEVQ